MSLLASSLLRATRTTNATFVASVSVSSPRGLATHWDPKFRRLRGAKVIKPELPDYEKIKNQSNQKETKEERRSRSIKEGISPPVTFEYKPINFATSSEIFDQYVPPEGDGKASSFFSKEGALGAVEKVKKTFTKKFKHSRAIRKYDEGFDENTFGEQAQKTYMEAHEALMDKDSDRLLEHATENAYGKMWVNMKYKTIKWQFIEPLEQTEVVHVITREMLSATDLFAQVTVRFHTRQKLAVYDRFGRLAFGSDELVKDVLEYVVFEKYLTNPYGRWRMHDKIVPDWAPPKTPVLRSYVQPKAFQIDESVSETALESKFKSGDAHLKEGGEDQTKSLA